MNGGAIPPLVISGKTYEFKPGIQMKSWARGRYITVRLDAVNQQMAKSLNEAELGKASEEQESLWNEFLALAFTPEAAQELTLDKVTYSDMLEIVIRFTPAVLVVLPKPATA